MLLDKSFMTEKYPVEITITILKHLKDRNSAEQRQKKKNRSFLMH